MDSSIVSGFLFQDAVLCLRDDDLSNELAVPGLVKS